ncbi:MAG: aminotransferase class III-fold pyridoxal phosphate-dependent enzyme, partial [Pseudomonadota bacterium]
YSGHPIACAAGLAAQEIYQRENLFARAKELSEPFLDRVWSLADHPLVYDIRGFGLMAGVEVIQQDQSPGKRGTSLQKRMFENGLHVKFTGDSAILAPPLISKEAHLDEIIDKFRKTLNEMT